MPAVISQHLLWEIPQLSELQKWHGQTFNLSVTRNKSAAVLRYFKIPIKEKYYVKMESTKFQWITSAPVVPVRAHLFTSHAHVSPCSLLTTWILICIHLSSACGSASKHLPGGVCCLRFTASLIDLASLVSWGDLHLGQLNLNPSLGCRLQVSNSSDASSDYFQSLRK